MSDVPGPVLPASGSLLSDAISTAASGPHAQPSDAMIIAPAEPMPLPVPTPGDSSQGGEVNDNENYDDTFGHLDSSNDGANAAIQVDVATCVERWCNAGPEAWKKMFALSAVTGIFVCLCHHGHPLVMCDMIWSGEL